MYISQFPLGENRVNPGIGYIRLFHASPNAPVVDVYANNKPIARRVRFKNFTEYFALHQGMYEIKVFPAGSMRRPILETNLLVPENRILTVAIIGEMDALSLKAITEPSKEIAPGKVMVRFIHLSPDAPPVDIVLPDGKKIFEDVEYREVTDYIQVNPGVYNFQAKIVGTNKNILYIPNIRLKANRFYSIYAVGLAIGNPPLQVVIPLDGNTYLKF